MFQSRARSTKSTARISTQTWLALSVLASLVIGLAMIQLAPSAESKSARSNRSGSERQARQFNLRLPARNGAPSISGAGLSSAKGFMPEPAPPLATIVVDTVADIPLVSVCSAAPADCSLRGAVAYANSNPGTTISIPAGTYQLLVPGGAVEGFNGNNTIGDLDITGNNTSIVGDGASTTIIQQTQPNDRVIEVNPFLDAGFNFSISGLTISGGRETTSVGGGGIISGSINNSTTVTNCAFSNNSATGAGTAGGGAISNLGGGLSVSGTTFTSNSTSGSGGAIGYSAGDPFGRTPSVGTLAVSGSTFTNNTSSSSSAGGGALDLFNFNGGIGTYTVNSSSFSGNNASAGSGGAINVESGPLTVTTCSFATNHAAGSGGAIVSGGSATVTYSRLAGNTVTTPTNGMALFRRAGTFAANDNWWGSNSGPGANGFRQVAPPSGTSSVTPLTWLQLRHVATPNTICGGATSSLAADILGRNVGSPLTSELNGLPAFPANFINTTPALGVISGASSEFINGQASATFTAGASTGTANIDAIADSETVTASVVIQRNTTSDPPDQTVCEGATATFSTTAAGPGPVTFVWKKGATVLNDGDLGGRVSITGGGSTLSISNVQSSDADVYSVEATGACNSDTQSATLTLNAATTATDPDDATVCKGATANFSTTASGTGPFHYAWKVDGSSFDGDNSSINVPTSSMSVGPHTVDVTVTGACGTADQSATLTVKENTATSDPDDATVCQGATASFSTTASGTGPFSYAWTLDGAPFNGNSPSINVPTGSLSVGNHTVAVTTTGECGNASQSATLTVQENTATSDPPDQAVCQGAAANFSTTASGTGPFSYAWTLDGAPYNGNSASINVPTGSLSVGPHTVAVTVSGTCGNASQSATLNVLANTTTSDPADQTVCQGTTVNFSTTASGTGPFTYVWKKGATVLNTGAFGGRVTIVSSGNNSTLTISSTQAGDAGTYSVETTGACNTATQSATLTVNGAPVTAVGPANVWIGVKNSDDVGTKFDLLAEVLRNGVVIGSGQLNEVPGGSSGFNNAVQRTINMALTGSGDFCSGGTLSFRLSVRIAASSGHVSGTARLWYNDAAANSRFDIEISGTSSTYYLRDLFVLATTPGPGPKKTIDVLVNRNQGGNPFKPFGTWNVTF
jgi:Immunoglobulin I-set domain